MTELPTGEALVRHTAQLARDVAAGRTELVPDLITAATALEDEGDAVSSQSGPGRRSGRMIPTGDPQADFRNRVEGPHLGYMATTAGELRRLFPPDPRWTTEQVLGGWALNVLPSSLPAADTAAVAIFGSGYMVSGLLWHIGRGEEVTQKVDRIIARVVHHRPRPWED